MKKYIFILLSLVLSLALSAQHLPTLKTHEAPLPAKIQKGIQSFGTKKNFKKNTEEISDVSRFAFQLADSSPISLIGDGFLVGPEYDDEEGEWYIALETEGYTFRLCWYADEDDFTGTFETQDMDMSYCWGWYNGPKAFYEIHYTSISMTISEEVVSEHLSQIVLDATITDTQDNTYQLHVKHKSFSPTGTVKHMIKNSQLSTDVGEYTLSGSSNELDVELTVLAESVEGAYTHTNFNPNKTKVVYQGVEQEILQATLIVQPDYMSDGGLGYAVDFSFYNQDTILHQVSMPTPLPAAKDTIEVVCTNLDIDDSFGALGFIMLTGDNEEYDVFAMYAGSEIAAGVYDTVAVTINPKTTWQSVESITAQLALTQDAEGKWYAHIETYAMDYNYYVIDMSFIIPTPTHTVEISFEQTAMASYNPGDDHTIQLLAVGDEWEASVTTVNVMPGESFSAAEVLFDYSGLYSRDAERSIRIADINGTLSQSGDTTYIKASVIGFNAVQYDVTLWYCVPVPVDTVEIDMPVEFNNSLQYGYYTLSAYTPDSAWYVTISPISKQVAGTFVNDGVFGKFGGHDGRYDFFGGNTFIHCKKDSSNHPIEKGELVVKEAADGSIFAEAKLIARNAIYYHIIMRTEYNEHLDYDEPYSEIYRTYTPDDYITIDDQAEKNGYIYIEFEAADGSDEAAFFFYVEESSEETIIPVGTYIIDYSEDYGTVAANPGIQGLGVWPSYYVEKSADGSFITPLWLLVGGTVEVRQDEDGAIHMLADAYNSYGVTVQIEYDGTRLEMGVSHISQPKAKVRKQLLNQQLMILRNGEKYNVLGSRVK